MTGLDLITGNIISEAKKAADEKIAKAKADADEIIAQCKSEIEKERQLAEERKNADVSSFRERGKAERKSYLREKLLETERNAAAELIIKAKEKILSMPKEKYAALLYEIYKNLNDDGQGEILLSKEDKEILPDGFVKSLSPDLKLVDEDAPSRGFIIRHGRVEQNCTIDAIFRERESEFYDIACGKE